MDKNTGTGILLIVLIIGGYMWWNFKNTEEYQSVRRRVQDSISKIEKTREEFNTQTKISDSINRERQKVIAAENMGKMMTASLEGTESVYTVETEKLILAFSNKGGKIKSVEFKDYHNYSDFKNKSGNPMKLFFGDDNDFSLGLFAKSQIIKTSDFYFKAVSEERNLKVTDDSLRLPFRLYADSVSYVEFLYTLYKDKYKVGFDVNFNGMESHLDPRASVAELRWKLDLIQQEKGFANESKYTTIAYKFPGESTIEDFSAGKETLNENIKTKLEWINFKQHFFSAIIVTNGSVNNKLSFVSHPENNPAKLLKTCEANVQLEFNSRKNSNIPLEFYFLPNHFGTLKPYGHSFEKIIPLGWSFIGAINRFIVIPVFNLLRGSVASFGLIILILTILMKVLVLPLTWKSYLSSAKMKALKPEIDKIGEKYPDSKDAMKKQQEVMALYKKTGVNMFGGCLPMLLQLPILYALFSFFPSSFELRQNGFLWADDLSSFDSVLDLPFAIPFYGSHVSLFTLFMALALMVSSKISMSQQSGLNSQMKQMNMMMLYVMPVMMLAFFNSYSSGLTYYYFLSNVITIAQTTIIRKYFVDEEALRKKLNDRAAKNQNAPKKLSFTERMMKKQHDLERLRKQQEKQQKQQKNKKRQK